MFRLFKRKIKDKDVITNPDILYNIDLPISEILVHGIKLQDKADLIPLDQVSTTTFEKYPSDVLRFETGGTRRTWKNNKVYYDSKDGEK